MIKNTVIFSDWTSVSQIVNHIDPSIKAEATAIIKSNEGSCKSEIVGYDLRVYQKETYITLYKVKIEMGEPNVWSLTSEQAVEMLNKIGFDCKYKVPEYYEVLSPRQVGTLTALKTLGYTHVLRTFNKGQGSVQALNPQILKKEIYFKDIKDYNYLDWIFLPLNDPQMIDGILTMKVRDLND